MKMVNRITAIMTSLVLLHASTLQAHTELSSIVPADGAVINQPLSALELSFTADVRLLRLTLMHAGQHSVDIGFKPTVDTKRQFSVPLTNLQEGPYELQWTIMGTDGHTMDDSSEFTLTSSATSEQGKGKPDMDHSAHEHTH